MSGPSIPEDSPRVKVFWGIGAHLAFTPTAREEVCPLCHRGSPVTQPACERCGQAFHFECYVAALPAGPEREFFTLPEEPGYLGIFLCGGCRS